MGMWVNFSKDEDEENLDQITATEEKEPIKLIDSVNTLTALTNRQKEYKAIINKYKTKICNKHIF